MKNECGMMNNAPVAGKRPSRSLPQIRQFKLSIFIPNFHCRILGRCPKDRGVTPISDSSLPRLDLTPITTKNSEISSQSIFYPAIDGIRFNIYKNTALDTLNFSARNRIWRTFNSRFSFNISETTPCDPTSDKSDCVKPCSSMRKRNTSAPVASGIG